MKELTVAEYLDELLSAGETTEEIKVHYSQAPDPHLRVYAYMPKTHHPKTTRVQPLKIVAEGKKYVIARRNGRAHAHYDVETWNEKDLQLMYIPKNLNHATLFSQSHTRTEGPKELAPGSVAVLYLGKLERVMNAFALQYCFKQGSPDNLSRSLVSKYMGAQKRLIESALELEGLDTIATINFGQLKKEQYANVEKILASLNLPFEHVGMKLKRRYE